VSVVVGVPDQPGAPGVCGAGGVFDFDPGGFCASGAPDHPGAPGISLTPPEP
jgi:hypothetical protein